MDPPTKESQSVASVVGLRPKISSNTATVGGSKVQTHPTRTIHKQQIKGNPLDRLCGYILNWKILEEISSRGDRAGNSSRGGQSREQNFEPLPDVYSSYTQYVEAWEPLMIKEMQESIMSAFQGTSNTNLSTGQFHCSVVDGKVVSSLTHLEANFNITNYKDYR